MTKNPEVPPPSSVTGEGRRKLSVDAGLASIICACIALVPSSATFVVTKLLASSSSSTVTKTTAKATPRVSISEPPSGMVDYMSSYSGKVVNLGPGQMVWTFNQPVIHESISPLTYPNTGPCTVDYAKGTWSCADIYVGSQNDTGSYRVCAAILDSAEAFAVVNLLRNAHVGKASANIFWFTAPPSYIHDYSNACTTIRRLWRMEAPATGSSLAMRRD